MNGSRCVDQRFHERETPFFEPKRTSVRFMKGFIYQKSVNTFFRERIYYLILLFYLKYFVSVPCLIIHSNTINMYSAYYYRSHCATVETCITVIGRFGNSQKFPDSCSEKRCSETNDGDKSTIQRQTSTKS